MASPELVEFDVVREEWTELALKDGIRVRTRPALVFLERKQEGASDQFGFHTAMTIVTLSPPSLRGKPGPAPDLQKDIPRATYTRDAWKFLSRGECIYRTAQGQLIFIRAHPESVSRYDSFTQVGEPFVVVNHKTEMEVLGSRVPAAPAGTVPKVP